MDLRERENYGQSDPGFQDEKKQNREDDLDSVTNEEKENYNNPNRDDNVDDDNLERDLDKDLDEDLDKELEDMEDDADDNFDEEDEKLRNDVSRDDAFSLTEDIDQDLEEIDPVNHPREFQNLKSKTI